MLMQTPRASWTKSVADGWKVSTHHAALIAAAVFAGVCERSLSLYMAWRGISWRNLATSYGDFISSALSAGSPPRDLSDFSELFGALGLCATLAIAGLFLFAGVLGLIRDLAVSQGFETRDLLRRSRECFWPIFSYKLPIYGFASLAALAAAPSVLSLLQAPLRITIAQTLVITCLAIALFYARILLSLGPKRIVLAGRARTSEIVREVTGLCWANPAPVLVFSSLTILLGAALLLMPLVLEQLGLSARLTQVTVIFTCGWATVFTKAAGVSFVQQLLRTAPAPKLSATEYYHG